jgi:hypothetical protein
MALDDISLWKKSENLVVEAARRIQLFLESKEMLLPHPQRSVTIVPTIIGVLDHPGHSVLWIIHGTDFLCGIIFFMPSTRQSM